MRDDALSRVFNVKGRTSTECKTRALNILAADVVGYSRLMEADEAGTLTRLKTIRLELIDPAIAKCKGRSVKTTGDGMLVEFQSVTEAVRCAVELDDIFAIQDEITSAIVATLFGRVEAARHNRVQRKRTANMAAYECVLTGKVLHHWSTREANAEALRMLNRAIELDPNYAHARAWKACVIGQACMNNWCEDRDASMRAILDEVQTALTLDENEADVHRILGALKLNFDEYDKAIYHQERALSLIRTATSLLCSRVSY
jgi:adenylate cyclase